MTKFISFVVSVFMFVFAWLIPGDKPFESNTMKIDGVAYKNGFVADNMHLKGEYNLYKEKPIHSEYVFTIVGGYFNDYYQIEDDLILKNSDTSWKADIKENLFCLADKWEDLHSYYENGNNYNYYYEVQIENGYFTKYDVQNADATKFDEIIQFSVDNEYGSTNNHRAESLFLPNVSTTQIRFIKESKDGLFETHTSEFIVYDGALYFYRYYDGSTGEIQVSVLPDDIESYFVWLLNNTTDQ